MKQITVDLLTDESNYAVLKLPNRKFPGVLFQGDSLKCLIRDIEEAVQLARAHKDGEIQEHLGFVQKDLRDLLIEYERALKEHGISLPY